MNLLFKISIYFIVLTSSILSAASSDLACKEVPVSIYYAGFKDLSDNQKYVYFNGSAVLEITPPASSTDTKKIKLITNEFSSPTSISDDAKNIVFVSAIGSEEASIKLAALGSVPVSIYYAGFKDALDNQKYVYFNGSAVLEITPPATSSEKKSLQVISNDFTALPTLKLNKCAYDVALDGYFDENFQACTTSVVNIVFDSLVNGVACSSSSSSSEAASSSSSEAASSSSSEAAGNIEFPPTYPDLSDSTVTTPPQTPTL